MARFCGKCGAAANDKATFCNKCGDRLQQSGSIRYSYDEAAPPQNPYTADPDGLTSKRGKGGAPIGVQPAVTKPGQRTAAPPPSRAASAASPTVPSYAAASPVMPSSQAPGSGFAPPPAYGDIDSPTFDSIDGDPVERAREIVRSFSAWCAGIVLVPIPFSDLVLLIPIQTAMILKLSRVFGVQDPPERILAYIASTSGVSVFGYVSMLIVANLFPVVGKLASAPFVYGWTYGLGEVAIRYFESQGTISPDEMKKIFKDSNKQAYRSYKKDKPAVSHDESLDALKDQLSPEEYEKLRNKFDRA